MRLARTARDFPHVAVAGGSIVTIGAFDGLHLGHQALLNQIRRRSGERQMPSVVMSFEPTPREFFSSGRPPARLMRFREKFEALREYGVELFFCPRFDRHMKDVEAVSFVRQLLIQTLNMRELVIGDDFRFARDRAGDVRLLRQLSSAFGYQVHQAESVVVDDMRVSSTAIRQALWDGEMAIATRLLGRPYQMSGQVVKGKRLGRQLGFPTANVDLRRRQSPVMGIFAVRVRGLGGDSRPGVASVGTRPTFDGVKPLLEVHLFDFDRDIYGQYIQVEFISRIRDEVKFDDVNALIDQMHRDSAEARAILQST